MNEPTRLSLVAVKRSVFQGVASMALPAFTIHTAVKQASKAVRNSPNVQLKRWGPTAVGLGIVPALPFLFDHPVSVLIRGDSDLGRKGQGQEGWAVFREGFEAETLYAEGTLHAQRDGVERGKRTRGKELIRQVEKAVDVAFEKIEEQWFRHNHPDAPVPSAEPPLSKRDL